MLMKNMFYISMSCIYLSCETSHIPAYFSNKACSIYLVLVTFNKVVLKMYKLVTQILSLIKFIEKIRTPAFKWYHIWWSTVDEWIYAFYFLKLFLMIWGINSIPVTCIFTCNIHKHAHVFHNTIPTIITWYFKYFPFIQN